MSKLRPQVVLAMLVLGGIAGGAFYRSWEEVASAIIIAVVALSKDLINGEKD